MTINAETYCSKEITVRNIIGHAEMRAVEALQNEVWGLPDLDVVPLTQLVAAKAAGGSLIGAFDGETIVGFVYGFAGYEDGRATHHSHMLAVKPACRNLNLGYRLKLAQREFAMSLGITEMTWTFDPLQSLNAYFNFNRLSVVSNRYLIDFYGTDAASFLHRNGTDRLWVKWPLTSRRVEDRVNGTASPPDLDNAEPLIAVVKGNIPQYRGLEPKSAADAAFIEIPGRIDEIEKESVELAAEWRDATRMAFTRAIAAGYVIVDFIRGDKTGKYLLYRGRTE
jgi:predicted GNAT superfamily acetyltransferase